MNNFLHIDLSTVVVILAALVLAQKLIMWYVSYHESSNQKPFLILVVAFTLAAISQFYFGKTSIIPMLVMFPLVLVAAIYIFSWRKYRGTPLEGEYYQAPRDDIKNNKLITILFLPYLVIGLIIIFGLLGLVLYAWLVNP